MSKNGCASKPHDPVSNPHHYVDCEISPIDFIEAQGWGKGFCLGNAVKYIARAGKKGEELEDLRKAEWYLQRYIEHVEGRVKSHTDEVWQAEKPFTVAGNAEANHREEEFEYQQQVDKAKEIVLGIKTPPYTYEDHHEAHTEKVRGIFDELREADWQTVEGVIGSIPLQVSLDRLQLINKANGVIFLERKPYQSEPFWHWKTGPLAGEIVKTNMLDEPIWRVL